MIQNICNNPDCSNSTPNARFCSRSCSAKVTNSETPRRVAKVNEQNFCAYCKKPVKGKYCNPTCQHDFQRAAKIDKWLAGEIDGITIMGTVHGYIRQTYGNHCSKCGWNAVHPTTGKVPLELDHIDGNWANNSFENFRLLCPNCHALEPTSGSLNSNYNRLKLGLPEIPTSRRKAGKM